MRGAPRQRISRLIDSVKESHVKPSTPLSVLGRLCRSGRASHGVCHTDFAVDTGRASDFNAASAICDALTTDFDALAANGNADTHA